MVYFILYLPPTVISNLGNSENEHESIIQKKILIDKLLQMCFLNKSHDDTIFCEFFVIS